MKKVISLFVVAFLCFALAVPAFATDTEFVPSITYKDGPDALSAMMDGEDVSDCIVVTSIKEANEKTTDIAQDERDLLLDIYDQLSNGEMVLPLDGDYVIRELVDLSFKYGDCRNDDAHGGKDGKLGQEGITLTVDFDLDVSASADLQVLAYVDGEWQSAKGVKINADGTVTVEFEDICPVVFCVDARSTEAPPQTGDVLGGNWILWVVVLMVSAAAIVVLLINRRKIVR